MKTILQILTYLCVTAGVGGAIIFKDLRILGAGIIGGVLFWTLDFISYDEQRRRDTKS